VEHLQTLPHCAFAIAVSVVAVLDAAALRSTGKPFPFATRDW
jgi:hypothetical protein